MRLDKLLSECGLASRSETAKACRAGSVTVNGEVTRRADTQVDPQQDAVVFCGRTVVYQKYTYILLNKPDGYVSATEDGRDPVVTELLTPELRRIGLSPCGRLDKHTVGLMLLTNDGVLSHRLRAPKRHVEKAYAFRVKLPLSEADRLALEVGVDIGDCRTRPCRVELSTPTEGVISITEGKYHQIKRMMEAVQNRIVYLERLRFGPLALDGRLARGEWRELTAEEKEALLEAAR